MLCLRSGKDKGPGGLEACITTSAYAALASSGNGNRAWAKIVKLQGFFFPLFFFPHLKTEQPKDRFQFLKSYTSVANRKPIVF